MIRFVDLGDQILEGTREFAWFDTVVERFIEFNGTHVWDSWEDFEVDAEGDEDMDRFERLFQWESAASNKYVLEEK